ncbi:MAG TPA: hypothetical protein VNT79_02965, partial [Phycisphaerae bacterium]|nr:hypothetical protein [Phycisphaerae bacterium]
MQRKSIPSRKSGILVGLLAVFATLALKPVLAAPGPGSEAPSPPFAVIQLSGGRYQVGDQVFPDWSSFRASEVFQQIPRSCGTVPAQDGAGPRDPSDCSMTFTDPAAEYAPATVKYLVPVVVHVIQDAPGTSAQGYMTPANVQGQIDILNEDFLAIPGSPGASGNDAQLEFFLANTTPAGLPTTGIDYIVDAQAFNDAGAYWQQYSWDPNNYLNIYTLEIPID